MQVILVFLIATVDYTLCMGIAVCMTANLATTVWLHRALTHRSIIVGPLLSAHFKVLIWVTTGIKPREWVAVHRKHHARTDVAGDPHSPHILGLRRVLIHDGAVYREELDNNPGIVNEWASDIEVTAADSRYFDHGNRGLLIGIGVNCLIATAVGYIVFLLFFGNPLLAACLAPVFGLVAGWASSGVHAGLYLLLGGFVNGITHWFGYCRFRNKARNSRVVALLTGGEGLHNNHHGRQQSPRLWAAWSELPFDWGYWFIWFALKLGLLKFGESRQSKRLLRPRLKELPRLSRLQAPDQVLKAA